jgi:hypothetical protein
VVASQALEEWLSLAEGAKRNVPVLWLAPPVRMGDEDKGKRFNEAMMEVVKGKHVS